MAAIGFIGLGNMGLPMARNLLKSGHRLVGYDVAASAVAAAASAGADGRGLRGRGGRRGRMRDHDAARRAGTSAKSTLATDGVIARAEPDALLIDCSTIDVDSARAVNRAALERGLEVLDAPVSGGVAGAENASLTFMVGGSDEGVTRARPILEQMGKAVVHTGPSGNGQAAKICNNMILAVSMIAVSEAFVLAQRLGLRRREAVRGEQPFFRPVLVAHQLLPGARTGPELARQPGLPARLHCSDDGQGSAARSGCGAERRCAHAHGSAGPQPLRAVRQSGAWRSGFLRDHQDDRWRSVNNGCKLAADMLVIR